MLREYAVEPELAATWSDRKEARYFRDQFGLGSPRIISRYPGGWKKQVWAAWKGNGSDTARKRMEELLNNLSEVMVRRRDSTWSPDTDWLSNAVREHRRRPFHAILSRSNLDRNPRILVPDDLEGDSALWAVERGPTIPRQAEAMADALRDMLHLATTIVFVDPYFAPDNRAFVRVLSACLDACRPPGRVPGRYLGVLVITSGGRDQDPAREYFEAACREELPARLPMDQPVTIRRVVRRPGGERLHDRYVLTEHGGVSFPAGLDESRDGSGSVDLHLLTREQYLQRWLQYSGDSPEFDHPEKDIMVVGRKPRPPRGRVEPTGHASRRAP